MLEQDDAKRPNNFAVLGIGTALPPHCMKQEDASELAQQICCSTPEQARILSALYRRSGVKTRYMVFPHSAIPDYCRPDEQALPAGGDGGVATLAPSSLTTEQRMRMYEDSAFPLALRAAQQALADAETAPEEITHLTTVSCTGFSAPGVDIALIERLGLPATVERVHVGFMGCHGVINALRVAKAFAASDRQARVLLCAVELCSIHFQVDWEPKRCVGNAIFGDGAAALVGRGSDDASDWRLAGAGSCVLADSTDAIRWAIRDHGFEMELSPRVPDLIKERLRSWFEPWLKKQGFALSDVGSWAVHPGGPRILSAVEEALGLDARALRVSREVLSQCGNMSSPTVLFILDRFRRLRAPRPCVMLGFGPGLAAEAAIFV